MRINLLFVSVVVLFSRILGARCRPLASTTRGPQGGPPHRGHFLVLTVVPLGAVVP